MLFIFPQKTAKSFWMQNTYVPLDIAFLDDSGKIMQIEEMFPLSTRFTVSNNPCKYAVEVNQGWFHKNNIGVGFQMFEGDDWVKGIKKNAKIDHGRVSRFSQVTLDNSEIEMEPNQLEGEISPEQEAEMFGGQNPTQEMMPEQPVPEQITQPDPVVQNTQNNTQIIASADANGSAMNIVYWTLSGKTLPPRRLLPVPNEGYPIKSGPSGSYFTAYDSSPTIQGSGWEIKGGTPKNFTINNIISLEIVNDEGERGLEQEQTIEEPQNLWDKMRSQYIK
jgi:hypothetical protein